MTNEIRTKLQRRLLARKVFFASIIAWLVTWCFGAFILVDELRPFREITFNIMIVIFCLFVVSGLYLHNALCPKCKNRFSVRADGSYYNDFSKKCLNCGINLNEIDF